MYQDCTNVKLDALYAHLHTLGRCHIEVQQVNAQYVRRGTTIQEIQHNSKRGLAQSLASITTL